MLHDAKGYFLAGCVPVDAEESKAFSSGQLADQM
jgi:hypothetical protein